MKVVRMYVFWTALSLGFLWSCEQKHSSVSSPKKEKVENYVENKSPKPVKYLNVKSEELKSRYPRYKAGNEAMIQFLKTHTHYPQAARANKITGEVHVKYFVDSLGKVSQVSVLKGLGYGCDEEALRVVRLLGEFYPAQRNGKLVGDYMFTSVRFKPKD